MTDAPDDAKDLRGHPRSNVFLGAILRHGVESSPVRIRNLSVHGALINGAEIPDQGATVHVERGSLIARGTIAWRRGGQAGIRFDEPVCVSEWVRPTGHSGQRKVDMVVAAVREEIATVADQQRGAGTDASDALQSFGNELHLICEHLSELPGMSVELAEAIGKIDSIAQALLKMRGPQAS